jgi:N-formylglutamate amidohydrolase
MADIPICKVVRGKGRIAAAAVHDGHAVRDQVRPLLALTDAERLREEDPFTGAWAEAAPTQLVGLRSRFEVDLNRDREKAVYRVPDDAWGLTVWKRPLPDEVAEQSLRAYDGFYETAGQLFDEMQARHGRFVILDLHTYNHRRNGADGPPADPLGNPEVNIGTGTMDRSFWAPVIDRFMEDLGAHDYLGRRLDVRENVKFKGGGFGRWVHNRYPRAGCAIAIEFKKFFMDEWTGTLDADHHAAILGALRATIPGMLEALEELDARERT